MSDGINHAQGRREYGPDEYPIDIDPSTSNPRVAANPLHPPAPMHERLARFEIACEKLWPAVRHFGLCGCHPQYLDAIVEIGELLGKSQTNSPQAIDIPAVVNAAKAEAREEIASIMESAPQMREQIGRNCAANLAEKIRKLQLSPE